MMYNEIVEKVRKNEHLSSKDITGFQLIMLLQDKEIKDIVYHGNKFEINFIPITYAFEAYTLSDTGLKTFNGGEKIIEHWIHCYDVKKPIYVQIKDEYFEIILDLLEST